MTVTIKILFGGGGGGGLKEGLIKVIFAAINLKTFCIILFCLKI
jgi:hypothetical protein